MEYSEANYKFCLSFLQVYISLPLSVVKTSSLDFDTKKNKMSQAWYQYKKLVFVCFNTIIFYLTTGITKCD